MRESRYWYPMPPYYDFIDGANLQKPTYQPEATDPTGTASLSYSTPNPPPARSTPSHIVHDPKLLQKMQGSLKSYLRTKLGQRSVSDDLTSGLGATQRRLARRPRNLTNEAAAREFFTTNIAPLVEDFVYEVDDNSIHLEQAPTNYDAKPDPIWGERVHVEFKSARALFRHAFEISNMAKANGGKGSPLVLGQLERDGRFIVFKVFLPISLFLLLLNGLSDWDKHGNEGTYLGNSYLRSRLHLLSSACSRRYKGRAPSHSLLFRPNRE